MRKWLSEIRESMGISQYKAAELSGISQSYFAAIETGGRGKPLSVDIAKKIANALNFDWQRFYQDEETA